jgi:hypothetical protein
MKSMKLVCFFVSVLLAGFLAGCVNPISPAPGAKESAPAQAAQEDGPAFTVTLTIGEEGGARSVYGGITGPLAGGNRYIINVGQLVVVDKDTRKIIYCTPNYRQADGDSDMTFSIADIPFGREYVFMLLMGHKERTNYSQTTNYEYKTTDPTLLLAGTATKTLITSDKQVKIDMWPLVVDTKFFANPGTSSQLAPLEPATVSNKPGVVFVPPTATRVEWKVVQAQTTNGFKNLFAAHKLFPTGGKFKMITGGRTIVRGVGLSDSPVEMAGPVPVFTDASTLIDVGENVSTIHLDIDTYTNGLNRIGKLGSVNFERDYVPFGPDIWTETENGNKNKTNPISKWIIRNGINSEPQDENTVFVNTDVALGWANGGANGNGAIRFKPAVGPGGGDNPDNPGWDIPNLGTLEITKGEYKGNSKIDFTLAGIPAGGTGTGQVYYTVASTKPTAISSYTGSLGSLGNGSHAGQTISSAPDTSDKIFLLLYKDGKFATYTIKTSDIPDIGIILHGDEE